MEKRGWEYRRRQSEGTVLYEAVRENLATLLEEASEVGRGLPRYVERDFARYLECGVLAHGFARVRCESCKDETLVAFSCKGRGVCPSCNAKRAHVTAHLLGGRPRPACTPGAAPLLLRPGALLGRLPSAALLGPSACFALLADVHLGRGEVEPGLAAVREAETWAERLEEHFYEAELHHLKGQLLWKRGDTDAAQACLDRALEVSREQEARYFERRVTQTLDRLR